MIPLKVLLNIERDPITTKEELLAHKLLYPTDLAKISAVGILTEGTEAGLPVVIIRMDLPDGTIVLGQTTLRLFQMAAAAFRGRYEEAQFYVRS